MGCSDFILKPFSDETLILKVYNLLGKENQIKELTFPLKPLSEKDGNPADPGLSWNQGFEIGVEEIDNEHREILERFVILLNSMREGKGHSYYNDLLLFLKDYVNTHFAHEETLQLSMSYDGYAEHKKHHDDFKEKIQTLAEIKATDEVSNSDLIKLNLFVKDWLLHHILFEDQKLGEFVHRLK